MPRLVLICLLGLGLMATAGPPALGQPGSGALWHVVLAGRLGPVHGPPPPDPARGGLEKQIHHPVPPDHGIDHPFLKKLAKD